MPFSATLYQPYSQAVQGLFQITRHRFHIMEDRIPKGVKDALLISELRKDVQMRVSLATATLPHLSTLHF